MVRHETRRAKDDLAPFPLVYDRLPNALANRFSERTNLRVPMDSHMEALLDVFVLLSREANRPRKPHRADCSRDPPWSLVR